MKKNILIIIGFSLIFLTGCSVFDSVLEFFMGEKEEQVEIKKKPIKIQEVDADDFLSELKTLYDFNPIGKRDPFEIVIGNDQAAGTTEKWLVKEGESALARYELRDLSLSGIIWGVAVPKALINAPDGKSYVVAQGDLLGKNYGKVKDVRENMIIVVEEFKDAVGKLVMETHEIYIAGVEEESQEGDKLIRIEKSAGEKTVDETIKEKERQSKAIEDLKNELMNKLISK
ncbi:MAG: pilus assembly protein PilP [Pseudomonadota bacterium]